MKEFIELRRKAKENRDKAIDLARRDYEETLTRIAALEQDLLGKHISSHKFMSVTVARMCNRWPAAAVKSAGRFMLGAAACTACR